MVDEVLLHKHILLCGDNYNSLGIIRSLGEKGISPIVILLEEGHCPLVSKSRYVRRSNLHSVYSFEESVEYLIAHFGNEERKPFVYTTDDWHESYLDRNYERLVDHFYFYNCGKVDGVNELMNKDAICAVAESCGFRVPKREVVEKGVLPVNLHYPVITKTLTSNMGKWKGDVYICRNEAELIEAYEKIKSPKLLLEEYIEKKNERDFQGFSINNGNQVSIPFEYTFHRLSEKTFGYYHVFSAMQDGLLKEKLTQLIRKCRFSGLFEIEFLIDRNGEMYFLEVNFRSSAFNYPNTYGGANLPFLWSSSMLMGMLNEEGTLLPHFNSIDAFSDFSQSVLSGKINIFHWAKDVVKANVYYIFDRRDQRPFWRFMWYKLMKKNKKK